ncbi:hypothetical protein HHK36_009794 [Tetracentron sinense]|uniref:DUF4371 domain-containing protein n=1 Tax=Tetracentron sinense TaxID=13715 RepID=A0A835DLX3_TETSI|nr:hypothetical protein HHK36_009794 [Tetracentron sinense]
MKRSPKQTSKRMVFSFPRKETEKQQHGRDIPPICFWKLKLFASNIQKDIVSAAGTETTNTIINEVGGALFTILIYKSCDIFIKEQLTVVLCYVDKWGSVTECFLGIVHATKTMVVSLKAVIDELFFKHGLSVARLCGQGYDGASNMQGKFNDLKMLIMNENEHAFYVHCFVHQLQLALVAVAKKHIQTAFFFNLVYNDLNIVGALCKHRDILREKQIVEVIEAFKSGEISSEHGLNKEICLKQIGDTCWGSQCGTLISLIVMFSSMIDVLEIVMEDGSHLEQKAEACGLLDST